MAKEKYIVYTENESFYSNSRNARKHLKEQGVKFIDVYTNDGRFEHVCRAVLSVDGLLMVGAVKKGVFEV